MNEYKILDSVWYNYGDTCIGIVAIESWEDQWKAYIAVTRGYNKQSDEQSIAARGAKLKPEHAHAYFPHLDPEKYGV